MKEWVVTTTKQFQYLQMTSNNSYLTNAIKTKIWVLCIISQIHIKNFIRPILQDQISTSKWIYSYRKNHLPNHKLCWDNSSQNIALTWISRQELCALCMLNFVIWKLKSSWALTLNEYSLLFDLRHCSCIHCPWENKLSPLGAKC